MSIAMIKRRVILIPLKLLTVIVNQCLLLNGNFYQTILKNVMQKKRKSQKGFTLQHGFTLIELMIVILITIFSFSYIIELVSSDGSGVSKILIFESVIKNFYKISSFEFLFGYGINQGNYIYSFYEGEYSHLLLTMLLGQVGLIGLIAYMFFFLMMILKSNNEVTIVFIPFFIVGLSYLHPFLESVFFSTGFVYGLSRIKNN